MSGYITEFHGRNGVLRKISHPFLDDILYAKVSPDGTSCVAVTESGLHSFPTFTNQPVKLHLSGAIQGLSWVHHGRIANYDLSLRGSENYLIVVDLECNICIYSVFANEKTEHAPAFKLASFISNGALKSYDDEGDRAGSISITEVVDAAYDDIFHTFGIVIIINDQRLLKVVLKQEEEPVIDLNIKLNQYTDVFNNGKCCFLCSKAKDSLLLLIDEYAVLYSINLESKTLLEKCNLLGSGKNSATLNEDAFWNENGNIYHICSISSNLQYVLIYNDDERILYQIQLNIEEIEFSSYSTKTPKEKPDKEFTHKKLDEAATLYGMSIQNEVWKNEINIFHKEITGDKLLNFDERDSDSGLHESLETITRNHDVEREAGWPILAQEKVALPEWMDGFKIKELKLDTNTALIRMAYSDEEEATGEETGGSLNAIILQYDLRERTLFAQSLPEKAVIVAAENGYFPTCILSKDLMYVPMFDTTQEELISNIIQYTGIAEAEIICKSNQWSQFSIPLHSLEVGLQHRQIDTISFFLRTRDKAFSRYWEYMSNSSMTSELSNDAANREELIGSPSLKSILVKSSMDSTSIDPNELYRAVDMLVKGIHHNSKGKHKKNFFETLLRLTIDFLNSLIMDGVGVLESMKKPENREPKESFTFLADIPESLSYLVNCIVDVRQFISDIPEFYSIQEDEKTVNRVEATTESVIKSLNQREYMEAEIYAGRLPHLQKYFLESGGQGDFDCSFEALTEFGLDFAFRKLKERDLKAAVSIMRNLGVDERGILRQLFNVTLDRGLRNYLLSEFDKDPYMKLLTEKDLQEVKYLKEVEEAYPCNVYDDDNIKDEWQELKANLHDFDDLLINDAEIDSLKSLSVDNEKNGKTKGLYSEVMFKWVKEWDERSRKMVLLDAAFQTNQLEHIDDVADTATLWEYLTRHNDIDTILEWIKASRTIRSSTVAIRFPPFDPSLIHKCGQATRQVQRAIYREFLSLGIYTEDMKDDFDSILEIVSEDCSLFKTSDEIYTVPPIFINLFIEHCLRYSLREVLYIYLDHHGIYPSEDQSGFVEIKSENYPWFKMMSAFRNYQKDKKGILDMSLRTAENMLKVSGEELKNQLCQNTPLTVLATVLASSLELDKVFIDDAPESAWIDEVLLRESLRKYPTLHAAIFNDSKTKEEVTPVQLLQDNTQFDANTFFMWRQSGHSQLCVPNFSSNELVEHYGLRINMTFTYYLKQKRPVYAYLIFVTDIAKKPTEKEYWMKRAFWEACEIAMENFDKIPIVASCVLFVDLLGMDSYSMRVDIESANFILNHFDTTDSARFDTEEELRTFIVTSLKKEEDERRPMLELLQECVEAGLKKSNIWWCSFEAILYYRIAVQFAQVSNLAPTTRLIEEAIKDGCWFHAIVFMQIYQLKPSEILPSLEKSMKNTVLRDHVYAIIKNAKEMVKVPDHPPEQEQSPKRERKGASLERDFRAQFYFNLKKGPENKPVEGRELVSPTKSAATPSAIDRVQKQDLSRSSSGSADSINERVPERHGTKAHTLQHLSDVLDIVLECEDTKCPSEMLLMYATRYSQPFLAVLAACYQENVTINCFSSWIISNVEKSRRTLTFESVTDLGKLDWSIEEVFCLLTDVLKTEEKSIKIIADGFKIFMPKNILYSFFKFCHSFAAKEDRAVCIQYLHSFVSALCKIEYASLENDYVKAFFKARIPIKVFMKFNSNFYKRKLLQIYIDSGLDRFMPQNSISFTRLKTICELTKDTDVAPDYLTLASCIQNSVNSEEDRIYELLIKQNHLEKASEMSKLLDLPAWKVTFSQVENEIQEMKNSGLWQNPEARFDFWVNSNSRLRKCSCSHSFAGSFFEDQGLASEELPYEERALLLAFAFCWYADIPDHENISSTELKTKLDKLEKNTWLFKMNAEIQRIELIGKDSTQQLIVSKLLNNYNEKISELLNRKSKGESNVSYLYGEINLLILDDSVVFESAEDENWSEKENEAFELMIGELLEKGEIAQAKRVSHLFGKKTHDLELVLTSISLAQGLTQVEALDEGMKNLLARTPVRSFSLSGSFDQRRSFKRSISSVGSISSTGKLTSEWVVVEEVHSAIEKLLSKCKKGRKCCEMVLLCFRISKILLKSYDEVVSLEPFEILQQLIFSDMDQPLSLCRQFLKVFSIRDEEVAGFIKKIVFRLIKSKANIDLHSLSVQEFADSTKLNSNEIPRLMQLVQKPSILGALLLEEARSMASNQKDDDDVSSLEVCVELLIRAHDCFTLSCNMEGISDVLYAAALCNTRLIETKSYSLMVRMLTGIGRFKEMSYIFEALADRHHFELLFRKDIEKEAQLKSALLDYIKKNHPDDAEKIDMLSRRFGMHREVGEQFEETGEKQIRAISTRFSAMSKDMETDLKAIAKTFSYAAANYKKVACLQKSTHCLKIARLAELQIRLLPHGKQIIGLEQHNISKILCTHQDFYEALIIADAYNLLSPLSWVDPLFERVILKGDMTYLRQYLSVFQLTGQVVMEIVSRYRSERSTAGMKEHLKELLIHLRDVKLRYKIAVEFNINEIINNLLEKPNGAYIKDSIFSF